MKSWRLLTQFLDDEVVEQVALRLRAFCQRQGIEWSALDKSGLFELAHRADEIFAGDKEAKAAFLGWIEVIPKVQEVGKQREGRSYDEVFAGLREEIKQRYGSGASEHLRALSFLTRSGDPGETFRLVTELPVAPILFTPRLAPARLIGEPEGKRPFGTIDEASKELSEVLGEGSIFGAPDRLESPDHARSLLSDLITRLRGLNWVTPGDRRVKDKEICGTEEWVSGVVRISTGSKRDRDRLSLYVRAQRIPEDVMKEKMFHRQLEFLFYLPNRVLSRLVLFVARRFRKRFPVVAVVLGALRDLGLKSTRDVGRLVKRYGAGLLSLRQMRGMFDLLPPTIYDDREGLRLAVPGDGSGFAMLSFWIYLLNEFCDIGIHAKRNYSILCPLGKLTGLVAEKIAPTSPQDPRLNVIRGLQNWTKPCAPNHRCAVKYALISLNVPGSLICGSGDTATHWRCFGDGCLHKCGELPFGVLFWGAPAQEAEHPAASVNEMVRRFRETLMPKPPSGEGETATRSRRRREKRPSTLLWENRHEYVAKLKQDLSRSGHSRTSIKFATFLFKLALLAGDMFMMLLAAPMGLAGHAAALAHRAASFPQRARFDSRRRRRTREHSEAWWTIPNEVVRVLDKVASLGGADG